MQISVVYKHIATTKNPYFKDNLLTVKPESCLLAPNVNRSTLFLTSPTPRRFTYFNKISENVDNTTGEIFNYYEKVKSNDIIYKKKRARSKLLRVAEILKYSESLAKDSKHKYKPFIITLTHPQTNVTIREFMNRYKIQLKRNNVDLLYFCWALEFGKNGIHPHYHIVIWVRNYLDLIVVKKGEIEFFKGFSVLFPDKYGWIGRTEVAPVKKSVYRYLTKYFTKEVDFIRANGRNYGYGKLSCNIRSASTP